MEISIDNFKEALRKGSVEFSYTKKDGSVRNAKGTLNVSVMGEENAPSGTGQNLGPDNQVRYYDLNSKGWRSFLSENLISWNETENK